jgi:uncharacterized repeat protein (TIGR01451 family)
MFATQKTFGAVVLATALVSACGGSPVAPTSGGLASRLAGAATTAGITSGADVQLSGFASTGAPDGGTPITYTFQTRNSGPDAASAVTLTDVLPAGTSYLGAAIVAFDSTTGPLACTHTAGGAATVSCTLGTIAKGGSATIAVTLSAPATAGTFSNTATLASSAVDPNPGNNSVTVTAQVKNALVPAACPLPAGQTTLHGTVMFTSSISTPNGILPQNFAFATDAGVQYYVVTNYYDASAPLTSVINLDCKASAVQFITTAGAVTVTGTFGNTSVNLFPPSLGIPGVPTFNASVVQVPTHRDKP